MKSDKPAGIPFDFPLTLDYDQTTGAVYATAQLGTSVGGQAPLSLEITPEAAVQLLAYLQEIEKTQDRPPSAHAKPRTRQ